jgi:hypothetical protein
MTGKENIDMLTVSDQKYPFVYLFNQLIRSVSSAEGSVWTRIWQGG